MKSPQHNTNPKQDLYAMEFKRTLCIDFDGVIHFYRDGWKGEAEIYDIPVPGAIAWLTELVEHKDEDDKYLFEVAIYSSRSKTQDGVLAMVAWLQANGIDKDVLGKISFPIQKPAAWITIDDRCFQFRGMFPTADYLLGYQNWVKAPEYQDVMKDSSLVRRLASDYATTNTAIQQRLLRIADELEGRR